MNIIGRCIGETSLTNVIFISKEMPQVGEYVSLKYDGKYVLGMIESLLRGNIAINEDIYDPKTIEKIKQIEGEDYYIRGSIRILGDINDNLKIPRTPAPPGTEINVANTEILKKIFAIEDSGLKLGNLISHEDVEVEVDINRMVTRHLAILAMTGAGKSNAVAVITDGLLKVNGCVLIFDMHSEYVNTKFNNGKVNKIDTIINPLYLSLSELERLANITGDSYIQERYFSKAYKHASNQLRNGTIDNNHFFESIENKLKVYLDEYKTDKSSITSALNKTENIQERYRDLLDLNAGDIIDKIRINSVNIIDLGSIDENASDIIVSHVLKKVLDERKKFIKNQKGIEFPVFSILEEAHILAPKSRPTKSKYWISRIAREGRKFGVGLCMVSQSPKSLDPDSLSQANNMIILRLVEPQDQRHVQTASESLSDDLVKQLPSLNIGEAIILGLMTKVPTLVKIDEFDGKFVGTDLNIVNEWSNTIEEEKEILEEQKNELDELEEEY